MDLKARQQTHRGFGDAMSRAIELALVPAVFGGVGWLVDRVLGTEPAFLIGLAVFGVVGTVIKMWIGYDLEMKRHEAAAIWTRSRTVASGVIKGEGPKSTSTPNGQGA